MYSTISSCRICGNQNLAPVLNLGNQYLTGVFPKTKDLPLTCGPLELVKCTPVSEKDDVCGLLQLRHTYNLNEMYGETYGYRSGLNQSMVQHLQSKVEAITKKIVLNSEDVVIDIGSNDCTLLKAYPDKQLQRYGVDPSAGKFRHFYPKDVRLIMDFFPSEKLAGILNGKKAKVVTSIAMFYDLEQPLSFVEAVFNVLDKNGIWVFEQSYLPSMIKTQSYDTVCHEHLEYYCLKQIKWMMDKTGFNIIDVELNNVNGGSFSVTVAKKESTVFQENITVIQKILQEEEREDYNSLAPYEKFSDQILKHKQQLIGLLLDIKKQGKKVIGYGASTKGNVILQYCGIDSGLLPYIAEVNEDKFGAYTPGSGIPIIPEKEAREMKPDYFLVLPWHFKENILKREADFIKNGGSLLFPLPEITIVNKENHVYSGASV